MKKVLESLQCSRQELNNNEFQIYNDELITANQRNVHVFHLEHSCSLWKHF